jgi:4-hydroxybenzoate polyprenyltransferase
MIIKTSIHSVKTIIKRFAYLTRADKWWPYKLPPLLFILYFISFNQSLSPKTIFPYFIGFCISLSGLGIFGFVINDIFDIDSDAKSSKQNRISEITSKNQISILIFSLFISFIPWTFNDWGITSFLALFVCFLFPLTYSAPPLRTKERGVLGVTWDSLGAIALPSVFVVLSTYNTTNNLNLSHVFLFFSWTFVYGVRGILSHQLKDEKYDSISKISTFVVLIGNKKTNMLIKNILYPLELLLIGNILLKVV